MPKKEIGIDVAVKDLWIEETDEGYTVSVKIGNQDHSFPFTFTFTRSETSIKPHTLQELFDGTIDKDCLRELQEYGICPCMVGDSVTPELFSKTNPLMAAARLPRVRSVEGIEPDENQVVIVRD
jgi:hypothetical protein